LRTIWNITRRYWPERTEQNIEPDHPFIYSQSNCPNGKISQNSKGKYQNDAATKSVQW
jgi:hypothetical protein